jgi:putative FmdB family regulatory protein
VPTYQYACTACDERLEVVQKFTDDPLTGCPVCDGRLRKVFSAVGVVFKGSGFYRTDSRASGSKTPAGAADASTSSGSNGSGSDSSSTTTPATTSSPSNASTSKTETAA